MINRFFTKPCVFSFKQVMSQICNKKTCRNQRVASFLTRPEGLDGVETLGSGCLRVQLVGPPNMVDPTVGALLRYLRFFC